MNTKQREQDGDAMVGGPSTSRSMWSSDEGSRISLRTFFTGKKVYPLVADITYVPGEEKDRSTNANIKNLVSPPQPYSINLNESQEEQRCFRKFVSVMRKAWATRSEDDIKRDPDIFIKSTLRELFMYLLFLVLLVIICFGSSTPMLYYYTTSLRDNILKYKFDDGSGSFAKIQSIDDFWKFVESPLIKSLFWDTWYNARTNNTNVTNLIYLDDVIVGLPRLRLLRVKANSCSIAPMFKSIISSCYDKYSDKMADKSSFGPGNDTAWIYTKSPDSSLYSYTGQLGTYETGGFMQTLTKDKDSSIAIIKYLKDNRWLDRSSRAVHIDYTVYNSNIDLFCVIRLIIEFSSTGGAISKAELRSTKLLRYVQTFDYFVLCCEAAFVLFIIYYIIEEILEIKRLGARYFVKLWNVMDVFVVIISLSCILLNVFRGMLINSKLDSLLTHQNEYTNFDFVSYWQIIYNEAICINVFLAWIKIFKYISFNKTLTQFMDTLSRSMKDLVGFTIMFTIVFISYSILGYLFFSSTIKDYRLIEHSVFALFRIILGDFNFQDFYKSNNILGPIFFISYIFFVFFILMSMFIAIINDSFMEVKKSIDKMKSDFHFAQFFKRQIIDRLKRDKIVKIQEILEKGEIMNTEELSFHDWRKELQQHGYADVEIQAIFMKYDHDGDRVLDYDERNKMLQDIKERKMNIMEENTNENEDGSPFRNEENENVTEEQMRDLVERVDHVEGGLFEIIKKIDRVLEYLEKNEEAKISHQKQIRCSLKILAGSHSNLRM